MKLADISVTKGGNILKVKLINLKHSNNKNIRDLYRSINEFKKGCQPRTNIARDDIGDMIPGRYHASTPF